MKRLFGFVTVLAAALLAVPARAAKTNTLHCSFYGHAEQFEWREFDDNDTEMLKESGPIYGVGATLGIDVTRRLRLEGLAEGFFGQVDYDGATQLGIPIQSTTDYAGIRGEGTAAYAFPVAAAWSIEPYAGAGGRFWQRRINDSDDGVGYGYDEYWSTVYGILGLGATAKLGEQTRVFGKAAAHLPFDNYVRYDLSHIDGPSDVSVSPGEAPSLRAEGGFGWKNLTASVFYETMTFDKSDYADVGDVFMWQPKSEASFFGGTIGVTF